jgi:DNA-binding LacI/PurR family transcriptional regulator
MTTPLSPQIANRPARPLYQQIEHYLREQIASGALREGDLLPSVKQLREQFGGVNHLTVRQAIKNLVEDNLVRSVQGRGSFVTDRATRHKRIAVVLPHLEDTLFVRIARGAQEVLEAAGLHTLILDSRGSQVTETDHIAHLSRLSLDGALIFPTAHSNITEQIVKLKMEESSFVLVDRYLEDIATPCVVVDNYQGGYESACYLAKQGRRHVAWIGGLRSTPARLRLEGFRNALNDAGIACPGTMIKSIQITPAAPSFYDAALRDGVHAAVAELLEQEPHLDAIVCCNDRSALSVLTKLQEVRQRIPEDVAVIGFDDIYEAEWSTPTLTTIRQPMLQMGRDAAQMLLERISDKNAPIQKKVLPVELIQRESA